MTSLNPALADVDRGADAHLAETEDWRSSWNSSPMSRSRSAWQTSGRSQKPAGIAGEGRMRWHAWECSFDLPSPGARVTLGAT